MPLPEQRIIQDGDRYTAKLLTAGVPSIYHTALLTKKLESRLKNFIRLKVSPELRNQFLLILGKSLDDSYRVGSRLVIKALEAKVSVSMVGFKALNRVYKNSFRDPELAIFLRDRVLRPKILCVGNIDQNAVVNVWSDPRDLSWFRSMVKKRADALIKTVFCFSEDLRDRSMGLLLGQENTGVYSRADILRLGASHDG